MLYQPGQIPWLKRPSSDMAERTAMRPILDDTNAVLTPLFMAVVGMWLTKADTYMNNAHNRPKD